MKKYKQLTREQRYTIFRLLQEKKSYSSIAKTIGVHKSTVSREVRRNKGKQGYAFGLAHTMAQERKEWRKYRILLTTSIKRDISHAIQTHQWSPEQIVGSWRKAGKPMVSKSTIYAFLHLDKKQGGELYLHTRHGLKYRRNRLATRPKTRWEKRKPIEERPDIINQQGRIGDFEMDLIVGAGKKDAILTLVDRLSGYAVIQRLPNGKEAKPLAKLVNKRLRYLTRTNRIHSITTDNGPEFTAFRTIERSLNIDVYFAKPYCSSDKPHIEHLNKLIRQYIPKGTAFKEITDKQIAQIETKLNNRPRKKLNYKTPYEVFQLNL